MVQAAMEYVRIVGAYTVEPGSAGNFADRPLTPQQIAAGVVSLRAQWVDMQRLDIHLNILKGFHVNAHSVDQGLIATNLAVQHDQVEGIDYPKGASLRTNFSPDPVDVYSGEIFISVRFKRPITQKDTVELVLNYQACDENACLPEAKRKLSISGIG